MLCESKQVKPLRTEDAIAKGVCKDDSWAHVQGRTGLEDQAWATLFLRPKMVRVRLLSRGFFSEVSFLTDRPERTDRASDAVEPSSMYLSL